MTEEYEHIGSDGNPHSSTFCDEAYKAGLCVAGEVIAAARAVDNTFDAGRAELEHWHAMYISTELLLSLRAALSRIQAPEKE